MFGKGGSDGASNGWTEVTGRLLEKAPRLLLSTPRVCVALVPLPAGAPTIL